MKSYWNINTPSKYPDSPSLHDSFEDHEHASRDRFAEAETLGHLSQCTEAFPDCPSSLIEAFSYLDAE